MSDHPELDGYVPDDGDGRRRSDRRRRWMTIAAVLVLVAFLLPSLVQVFVLGQQQANSACRESVVRVSAQAVAFDAPFELFGPGVIGWECYAVTAAGERMHVTSLGLLPSSPGEAPPPSIGALGR